MTARSRILFATFCATAFALGVGLAVLSPDEKPAARSTATVATVFDTPRPLPAFTLTNASGRTVTADDLTGRRSWLFFGFTACPDVCPATLGIIANALKAIPQAQRPAVYLVSVDPERDTPERLATYVQHFDPAFDALTGDLEQVRRLADGLYATFAKVPLENGNYTMDHFAGIYFLDAQARAVAVSTTPHRAAQLAADHLVLAGR